ncbi:hypothetical protein [Vallitalea maricola]|uniref:Uncharacterized protein n=1 Tax=Vallitalea maricola TaxID=3074433 RepID=A0ACB5UNF1_9FIRM|nr:hypothetical protein AN2V17_37490 [Vallitalea sp. AN17-2]
MKSISKEDLIIRESMQLSFAGSDIWCIELDSLNVYTDIVIDKFLKDMVIARKRSSPSLIVIHLNKTLMKIELIGVIASELKKAENAVCRVVFVGLDRSNQRLIKKALKKESVSFAYGFNNNYEKAKEWLVSKRLI